MLCVRFSKPVYNLNESDVSSSDSDDSSESYFGSGDGVLSLFRVRNGVSSDDDEEIYSTGDAYLIPNKALKLEKMASVRIAVDLWNHAVGSLPEVRPDEIKWRRSLWERLKREWTPLLPLPKSLVGCIENHFNDILLNVKDWIAYHQSKIFWNGANRSDLLRCLHCIIWYPNGSINCYETALNLLKCDVLGDVEKYRLACTYCLKEEVKKQWQTLDGNKVLNFEVGFFYEHPLYYYWNYYFIDNLDKITMNATSTVDEFMIRQTYVDNWPAIEYFFDRMNVDQQTASALHYTVTDDLGYQNLIMAKLNDHQRLIVYTSKGVQIIENYARFGGADINNPNAILVWYEVRDLITPVEFASLMRKLCIASAADAVLTEIWTSAYDDFKSNIFDSDYYNFIGDVLQWCYRKLEDGYEFLAAVLAEETKPLEPPKIKRKKLITCVCEKLITDGELESVTRLLNLCVPDAEERAKLEEYLLKRS